MVRLLARVLGGPSDGGCPGDCDELTVDGQRTLQEAHAVDRQTEAFALAHAGARRQRDERL